MPNFRCKNINLPKFPQNIGNVEFLAIAKGRICDLLLVKIFENEFFLTIKKSGEIFIVKSEKITKPADLNLLQTALIIFKDNFCSEILNDATALQKRANLPFLYNEKNIFENIENFKEICIEIGFGSGRHLLYQAKNSPNSLFIGIEIYTPSINQVNTQIILQNLQNIRLLNCDARGFLKTIKPNFINKIFLHFPVPWDDAIHRRVISSDFVQDLKQILKKDGKFELRTDSQNYAKYAINEFLKLQNANLQIFKNKNLEISSKYEDRWKKLDKDIFDIQFTNYENSEKSTFTNDLNFSKSIKIDNFKNYTIKENDFFIHFEDIFEFENKEKFIKVAMGDFDIPQNLYILLGEKPKYLIKQPLKTANFLKAHKKIEEIL